MSIVLAFGCFASLASCGNNKVAANVEKGTTPTPSTTEELVAETPAQETSTSDPLAAIGVTPGGDPYALPDNASQKRVDWVVNAGYGQVYNMYMDENGIVYWCFDNEVNPRMTQII